MSSTSPRGIIPIPTRSDPFAEKPNSFAKTAHPIAFAMMATMMSAIVKAVRGPSSRAFAWRPMLIKKSGTKIE